MPRICYVIPTLGVGGTERQIVYLLRGLKGRFDTRVVCTREEGEFARVLARTCPVEALGLRSGWDPRAKGRLEDAFEKYEPDIVHSFMFGFDHPVNVAARNVDVPVVVSSRRQLAHWKKPRHLRMQRKANALVDGIVANSRAAADFAAEQEDEARERYQVISNGIDAHVFASPSDPAGTWERFNIPEDKQIIGMVANFSPVKDHALFVRIAKVLRERRADVFFLLVGDGPLREDVEKMFDAEGLGDCSGFVQEVDELPGLYATMSAVVLCSKSEGFPNVIMEAMAAGRPVVAANVGGIPELVRDRVTGRLVDSRAPEDFADAVERVLDSDAEARALTLAASVFVRDTLTIERMVNEYAALYDRLLSKSGARRGSD